MLILALLVFATPGIAAPAGTMKEVGYVAAGPFVTAVNCGNDAGHIQTPLFERPQIHRNCASFTHDRTAQTIHLKIADATQLQMGAYLTMFDSRTPGPAVVHMGICGGGDFEVPAGIDDISVGFHPSFSRMFCGHTAYPTAGIVTLTY